MEISALTRSVSFCFFEITFLNQTVREKLIKFSSPRCHRVTLPLILMPFLSSYNSLATIPTLVHTHTYTHTHTHTPFPSYTHTLSITYIQTQPHKYLTLFILQAL